MCFRYCERMSGTVDLQAAIGANVRRLRGDASMAELAVIASKYGEIWDAGSIGKIEAGKYKATIQLLGILSMSLSELNQRNIRISELLQSNRAVSINKLVVALPGELLDFLADRSKFVGHTVVAPSTEFERAVEVEFRDHPEPIELEPASRVYQALTHGDRRIARELSMSSEAFAVWCSLVWERPFTVERDERAGPDASAQKRGRISRELKQELLKYMERYGHGDGQ